MAYSYVEYTGNGTLKDYLVSFPYLDIDDVNVSVNGVVAPYTWATTATITITTTPETGSYIYLSRTTSQATRVVNYSVPGNLTAEDLNADSKQAFYMAQEAIDLLSRSVIVDPITGLMTALNKRISNVADPVDEQDAATKGFVEDVVTTLGNVIAPGITYSYSIANGSGVRTATMAVPTTSTTLIGTATAAKLIDGSQAASSSYACKFTNAKTGTPYILFDFLSTNNVISEVTWHQSTVDTHGTWKFQTSIDGLTYTDITGTITLGALEQIIPVTLNVDGCFRYLKLIGVSANTSSTPYLLEINFKLGVADKFLKQRTSTTFGWESINTTDIVGIGTAALKNTGTTAGTVPVLDGSALVPSGNIPQSTWAQESDTVQTNVPRNKRSRRLFNLYNFY